MAASNVSSTNPELLRRVAALWDNLAWREFFARYSPFVRDRCSVYGLDADSVDETCQRVWVELARRMPSYQYDPGGSFRGWLRMLCHHRAINLIRERQAHGFEELIQDALIDDCPTDESADDGEAAPGRLLLLREALAVQEEVRRRVKPVRWEAFWRVAIEGQPVKEAAAALGLKYATVYAGVGHVAELLRAAGRRHSSILGLDDSTPPV